MFFQHTGTAVKASFEVFLTIAHHKKALVIGENLALPVAKVMVRSVFGNKSVKRRCQTIPFNNESKECCKSNKVNQRDCTTDEYQL